MVLADLGGRLQSAMTKLMTSSSVDESVINEMVKEIQRALLDADVNVRLVAQLSKSIKEQVDPERMALGIDKRIVVKRIVFEALCKLLDPGKKPYEVKKGRPNVIMFVGLQGSGKTTSCTKLAYYYHHKRRLKT